jgi:hypothetical protein
MLFLFLRVYVKFGSLLRTPVLMEGKRSGSSIFRLNTDPDPGF